MEETTLTLSELLAEAAAAASIGERSEAERLFRRATERSPGNTTAWLGLAAAVDNADEKRFCYEKVLAINPTNDEARIALQRLASASSADQARTIQETLNQAAARVAADPQRYAPEPAADPAAEPAAPDSSQAVMKCVNHPNVETTLRCNRCGQPVCTRCVELTDVGYRCKSCIRQQQDAFFNAETRDYGVAGIVSLLLAALATPLVAFLLSVLGPLVGVFLAFFLGPTVGASAVALIRRLVGRRRGRYIGLTAVIATVVGVGLALLATSMFGVSINLLPLGVFAFTAISALYAGLR